MIATSQVQPNSDTVLGVASLIGRDHSGPDYNRNNNRHSGLQDGSALNNGHYSGGVTEDGGSVEENDQNRAIMQSKPLPEGSYE